MGTPVGDIQFWVKQEGKWDWLWMSDYVISPKIQVHRFGNQIPFPDGFEWLEGAEVHVIPLKSSDDCVHKLVTPTPVNVITPDFERTGVKMHPFKKWDCVFQDNPNFQLKYRPLFF
ncbi:hypothetical protein H6F43_04155 [Leptolyngbya sp. FACHB-36]|uniref:hypothetical protein n=1 Tax=Leptolyngbya sp. FACHB-36 TaxID=2692808 RepID=UPI0016818635|nr:hypothetical protein [Leptolyngbya sp. FACHB-36]MBD2019376.1 hypothetical protein [Leptolyngbya sp. FACHB-36]